MFLLSTPIIMRFKMFKRLFISLLSAASFSAFATGPSGQQVTSSLVNSGSLTNTIRTDATVKGVGTAYSAATSEGYIKANATSMTEINPVCGGTCGATSGAVKVTGDVETKITGTAFNLSTGSGTGSASAAGSAVAGVDATAKYIGPGQNASVFGNVEQKAMMDVTAGKNTGGYASAGNTSTFDSAATVGSKVCTGTNACGGAVVNKEVWGTVTDNKTSNSFASTGAMTVDGVVLNQAPVNASASTVVNAGGQFYDPQ